MPENTTNEDYLFVLVKLPGGSPGLRGRQHFTSSSPSLFLLSRFMTFKTPSALLKVSWIQKQKSSWGEERAWDAQF